QIVGEFGGMREDVADLQTALAVLGELEWRLHQLADRPAVGADLHLAVVAFAVVLFERRFGVERIDLARRTVHEQEDAVLRLGRLLSGADGGTEEPLATEQIHERQRRKPAPHFPQEAPPRIAAGGRIRKESSCGHAAVPHVTVLDATHYSQSARGNAA